MFPHLSKLMDKTRNLIYCDIISATEILVSADIELIVLIQTGVLPNLLVSMHSSLSLSLSTLFSTIFISTNNTTLLLHDLNFYRLFLILSSCSWNLVYYPI